MATQRSTALTQLTDMTECCICLKTFTDPRMLPCIHTFCFQCLKEMVDKSDKKPGDKIKCPMCRNKFTIPNDGVQGIQKNFFVVGMIEAKNTLNKTNMQAVPCDACKANAGGTESYISEATLRCMDCQEYLCEDCYKMHKTFKMSRNHKVLKIGGGEEEAIKSFNVMNCDIHRGKVLDFYCADCKKVVCVSCFVESHKAHYCKDVNTVEEEFSQMIKSSSDKISTLAGELLVNKKKLESKEDFPTKIAAIEKEILQRSDELKKAVDENTKSLLSTLDEMKNKRLKEIQAIEDELDRQLMIVESFKRYCDELISKGSASDVCRSKDELLRRADELEEDHEICITRQRVTYDLTFLATDLTKFLKATNGNVIGSLKGNAHYCNCILAFLGLSITATETSKSIMNLILTSSVPKIVVRVFNNLG